MNAPWQPLQRLDTHPDWQVNPAQVAAKKRFGIPDDHEIWGNDEWQVCVRYLKATAEDAPEGRAGMMHLSIHRKDRRRIRDWRIMQQIKNEVAGMEREAVEVFPKESRLVDTANEYHLWVLPEGAELPFGMDESAVTNDEQVEAYNEARRQGRHRGRQHRWRPGLTTGRNDLNTNIADAPDPGGAFQHFTGDDMDDNDGLGG